ncbi:MULTISPECIES: hypothetical protein [unclassified Butyrivibrio]|jgi:hypothetical protein|uniref:hypothetical protein n=1 Tax=unclassified Butyrivibrio TaxID=2639466 RepID=UPI0003FA7716|nr:MULTISPECIES: hypothetical protein [unclassified Butyrivibrio]SCY69131.1 hypothetical protein SAMN02910371_03410 [Butyrivibrio sp. INlla14]
MEKRFREYLKHFEKLDYDVLSDEEIMDEKTNLQVKTSILHQELVRILIGIVGFLICASIFLSAGLLGGKIISFCLAAIMAVLAAYMTMRYKIIADVIKKLEMFVDKLSML